MTQRLPPSLSPAPRPQCAGIFMPALGALVGALLLPSPAQAVEVELKPGDDVATLTATLQAGDVFTFSGGTYLLEADVNWSGIGTEAEPIVLKAKAGEVPVLMTANGSVVARITEAEHLIVEGLVFSGDESWRETEEAYKGLEVQYTKFVTLDGIEVRNTPRQSILLRRDNEDFTLYHSKLHDSRDSQLLYIGDGNGEEYRTTRALIENNWLFNGGGSAIEIRPTCSDIQVIDNVMYSLGNDVIVTTSTGGLDPNIFEGNAIWGGVDAGFNLSGGAVIRNNVIFNIQGYGLYGVHPGSETAGAMVISHNTIVNTTGAAAYLRGWDGIQGMVFANNALTNPTGRALDAEFGEGPFFAGNIATGLVEVDVEADVAALGVSPGAGFEDYLDPQEWNYWPSGSSTLIDAGDNSAGAFVPAVDFNGIPRDGSAPDVGAMEWTQATYPGWSIREGFKTPPGAIGDGTSQDIETGCGGCGGDEEEPVSAGAMLLGLLTLGLGRRRHRGPVKGGTKGRS